MTTPIDFTRSNLSLALTASFALSMGGCGAVEYGPAVALNEDQRLVLGHITEVALQARNAANGTASAEDVLRIHARVSELAPAARPDGVDVSVDEGHLQLLDARCASGLLFTGFDFDGCRLVAPSADPELRGQVGNRDGVLDFELRVPAETTHVGPSRLDGELVVTGDHVTGELDFSTGSDGVAGDGSGTWWVGGQGPHVRVLLRIDATLDAESRCLADGSAEVRVEGFGGEDSVRYEITGCGEAQVRLERD